jgi:hypothetical protein
VNQFVFVERHRESLILLLRKGDKILFLIGWSLFFKKRLNDPVDSFLISWTLMCIYLLWEWPPGTKCRGHLYDHQKVTILYVPEGYYSHLLTLTICCPTWLYPVLTPICWADRGKANTHLLFV